MALFLSNGSYEDSIPHSKEKDLPDGGNWVVQKFGGTSIGKFASNICDIVEAGLKTNRIAIVCSARSNNTKSEGTTSRLLRAAKEAENRHSKGYLPIVNAIKADHAEAASRSITDSVILEDYLAELSHECEHLVKTLESAQHLEEVSFRAENKIISKGEKLAARYMAALLNDRGVPAQLVDLSDIVQKYDLSANRDGFYGELAQGIRLEVLGCGDKLPVVTGYFGNYATGLLHSIGRGYTDLCAALVAVGLGAQELQIWKEIDGIFTGDPRKIPTARLVPSVTPGEAAELSFYGSEVIHPFTMEQVIRERIPIRIKNVMNPRGSGTVIIPDPANTVDPLRPGKLFRTRSSLSTVASQFKPKRPTAVTTKHNIVVINMHSSRRTRAEGFLARIFGILDKWHLSVDLIASSEVHVSMACHISRGLIQSPVVANSGSDTEDDVKLADERLDGAVTDLADLGTVDLAFGMAIVSLVGKDLKNMTGISGRFFSVLGDNNINIEMISQGASEINISCVISERDADRAMSVLHTNLFVFLE